MVDGILKGGVSVRHALFCGWKECDIFYYRHIGSGLKTDFVFFCVKFA